MELSTSEKSASSLVNLYHRGAETRTSVGLSESVLCEVRECIVSDVGLSSRDYSRKQSVQQRNSTPTEQGPKEPGPTESLQFVMAAKFARGCERVQGHHFN